MARTMSEPYSRACQSANDLVTLNPQRDFQKQRKPLNAVGRAGPLVPSPLRPLPLGDGAIVFRFLQVRCDNRVV